MRPLRTVLASVPVAAALLAAPSLASAAIPTGSFELQFGGLQSIWMGEAGVDAGEEFCTELGASFDVLELCDFQAFVDGTGRIFGYLEFTGWTDGLHFSQGGPIKGTQTGNDRTGVSRLTLTIKLTGTASDGFVTAPTRSGIRLSGETSGAGLVSGVWNVRVCVNGIGCSEQQSLVPPTFQTDGEWSLQIEITEGGGGTLGGSARVEFGSGEDCLYTVSGKYSARRDTASLSLLPTESDCVGTSLRLKDVRLLIPLRLDGSRASAFGALISGSISYRLFGFQGNTEFGYLPGSLPASRQTFPVSGGAQGALSGHYSNQELFAFICQGTVAISASTDPSACNWAIPSNPDELAARQWALLEELQRARVPLDEPGASFGRRSFVFVDQTPWIGATLTISVIDEPPIAIEERDRSAELEP
jgi:hypothetical protein